MTMMTVTILSLLLLLLLLSLHLDTVNSFGAIIGSRWPSVNGHNGGSGNGNGIGNDMGGNNLFMEGGGLMPNPFVKVANRTLNAIFRRGSSNTTSNVNSKDQVPISQSTPASSTSFYKWWENQTKGSRGLLVIVIPAIASQVMILQRAIPFFTDRLSQYLQPVYVFSIIALVSPRGNKWIQLVLSSSIAIGAFFMLQDTYQAGSSWLPLETQPDSYSVITGASTGLGKEIAKLLFYSGRNIVIVSRQGEKLKLLKAELLEKSNSQKDHVDVDLARNADEERVDSSNSNVSGEENRITSTDNIDGSRVLSQQSSHRRRVIDIPCDLADPGGAAYVLRELRKKGIDDKINVLVHCAGYAEHGPLLNASLGSLCDMIDLNIKSAITLTRLLAPRIAKRGTGGRIVIIGSSSGLGPAPDMSVYSASKAFLASFASSLRRELMPLGVLVTLAIPGPIRPIREKRGARTPLVYRIPWLSTSAEEAASTIFTAMLNGRDVIIPGVLNRLYVHFISRILPPVAIGALNQFFWNIGSSDSSKGDKPRSMPLLSDKGSDYGDLVGESTDDYKDNGEHNIILPNDKAEKEVTGLLRNNEIYKKLERGVKAWAVRFWYSPVIDYAAIRAWLSYPFQKKGMEIEITDEDIDAAVAAGMDRDEDIEDNEIDQATDMLDEENTPTSGEMRKWQLMRLKEMMRRMKKIITEKEKQTQMMEKHDSGDAEEEEESPKQEGDSNDTHTTGSEDESNQDHYFRTDFDVREQARNTQRDSFFKDFFHSNDQQR